MLKSNYLIRLSLPTFIAISSSCFGASPAVDTAAGNPNSQEPLHPVDDLHHNIDKDKSDAEAIHSKIMADKSLSVHAKNVTITKTGNMVVLDGSVKSARELSAIRSHVRSIATTATIDDKKVAVAKVK